MTLTLTYWRGWMQTYDFQTARRYFTLLTKTSKNNERARGMLFPKTQIYLIKNTVVLWFMLQYYNQLHQESKRKVTSHEWKQPTFLCPAIQTTSIGLTLKGEWQEFGIMQLLFFKHSFFECDSKYKLPAGALFSVHIECQIWGQEIN